MALTPTRRSLSALPPLSCLSPWLCPEDAGNGVGRLICVVSWVLRTETQRWEGEGWRGQEIFPHAFGPVQLDRHPEEGPRVTAERAAQMPSTSRTPTS